MTRRYGYMDPGLAKRIISEIGGRGISEKITFHVMGEPTLHPQFSHILDHADAEGVNVGLTTNGGGLGRAVGRRLLDYDLHQLDVSIQTPDKASYALRKAGALTFENYIDGILGFFADYTSRHKNTVIKFRFMNTRVRKKGLEKKLGPVKLISSSTELQEIFHFWVDKIYDILDVGPAVRKRAFENIAKLVAYKWNVVEIYPNIHFETYMLSEWGYAFGDDDIRDAWAGYCFGMRDHFSILHNGDVILCCIDFDGNTAIGNLNESSLEEILSSDRLGAIIRGFKRFKPVHPYCKRCLGSRSFVSWLTKPVLSVLGLKVLKPFFYKQTRIF
jgi:MoaA/NifB/PqqE/SkfB family radical SAM enzyme